MRHQSSITSISWIPSEAMTGPMRLPMDLGVGHYDQAPPEKVEAHDLAALRDSDSYRFANHLAAWIQTDSGSIADAGYSGGGFVGSTTAKLGMKVTIPGVAFPLIQEKPRIEADRVVFKQTAGGRTGAPLPHRIDRPPFVRMTAPTAWTTLQLTIHIDGSVDHEVVGASPFPRHWVYGPDGDLVSKSGVIDYTEWTRVHDHEHTPWHDHERPALMADVESQIERSLSSALMSSDPRIEKLPADEVLITQGAPGGSISLILDGMLVVDVDGQQVAELGPGALVGERAILEGGYATATVITKTPVTVATIPADSLDQGDLALVAREHRREDE